MKPSADWLGFTAAALTSLSFLPQVWHTLRSRDVSGISSGMYSTFVLGVLLWLIYGISIESWPMIIANAVTLSLAGCILCMKIVIEYRKR